MNRIINLTILTILALFYLGAGCNSDKYTTIVEGIVINTGSRQGIDSVLVTLQDGVNASTSSGFYLDANTASDRKNQVYTDSHGAFRVELTGKHRPWLSVGKEGYMFFESDRDNVMGALMSYPEGFTEDVMIEMMASAAFKGVFQSLHPFINDTLIVSILSYQNIEWDYFSPKALHGPGPFIPFETREGGFTIIGDRYLRYRLQFTREGKWTTLIDSVYVKSFETFRDTIYY